MNVKLFVCVVLAAICLAQADFTPMSWTGKWTFNDGFMSMCTTADNTTLQVFILVFDLAHKLRKNVLGFDRYKINYEAISCNYVTSLFIY